MRLWVNRGKNKFAHVISMVSCICILCALLISPPAVSSVLNLEELTDIKAHWAEAVIRKWISLGLVKGYGDGRFGPNDNITRAEFVTLLNRIFGYQRQSDKSFPDVKAGAWYAGEIAKAYQTGIINGDNNGYINPEAMISRQEAAVIIARAFFPDGEHPDTVLKYSDADQIAEWALGAVGTMTEKGYVTGRPGNLFAPKENLSRSEAVKMIDNVMGELINTAGTYTKVVSGNLVISSPGVTLKNTYIAGDLYLTEGIAIDTVKLTGVVVKGKTIIAAGINSLSLTDTLLEQGILDLNEDGKVSITAQGLTVVGSATVPTPTQSPETAPTSAPIPTQSPAPAPEPGPAPDPGPVSTPTPRPTPASTPTPTRRPTLTPTSVPTPTRRPTPTPTSVPTPTRGPTPTPTPVPTPTRGPTPTPVPASTPTPTPTPQLSITPTPIQEPIEAYIYVSPTGNPHAKGTYEDPLDLQTVLNSDSPAKPGDLVILKEGKYSGRFVSNVKGRANSPVIFAAEPGKRVIIEGIYKEGEENHALFLNESSWVEFRDLEITSAGTDRSLLTNGLQIYADNSKIINCIIHDTAQAIFSSSSAINNELYGNIIYNNGFYSESYGRGRGHGIYVQNKDGTKRIANNILFFGYGFGIHAYAESGSIQGLDFERNVWFRTGASLEGSSLEGTSDGMLIGGATPVSRTRVIENYSWSPKAYSRNVRLGWGSTVENEFIELRGNYFAGNIYVQGIWKDGDVKNNHFYGERIDISEDVFPDNVYRNELPVENKVILHENEYDPNRIDLIIYNWEGMDNVNVSLGDLLDAGRRFEIYSVFDLWGEPAVSGIYSEETIQVSMGTKAPVQPNGSPNAITDADDPGRRFGVFVIRLQ